jgi:hypothetical protein
MKALQSKPSETSVPGRLQAYLTPAAGFTDEAAWLRKQVARLTAGAAGT